ncbi:hypothetical protein V6N12_069498 [Hibiscus sabdariffa]|uniref:Uncharacterized protein n=1 Tax=Hibiscus sabdariffa TaxID=183260 RepID=A0ABR2FE37_9ROSI
MMDQPNSVEDSLLNPLSCRGRLLADEVGATLGSGPVHFHQLSPTLVLVQSSEEAGSLVLGQFWVQCSLMEMLVSLGQVQCVLNIQAQQLRLIRDLMVLSRA